MMLKKCWMKDIKAVEVMAIAYGVATEQVKDLKVFGSYPKFPLEQFDELFETRALL